MRLPVLWGPKAHHYKAYYDLFWFRPLLRGNSSKSSGLILKMNRGYNEVSRARKVHVVKGKMISYPLPDG
jgi:hypothetical protein